MEGKTVLLFTTIKELFYVDEGIDKGIDVVFEGLNMKLTIERSLEVQVSRLTVDV